MTQPTIPQIKSLISNNKILWTEHISLRLRERKLKRQDLIDCIKNGEIIEQYPEDTPKPSCLVLGICTTGKPSRKGVINHGKYRICCLRSFISISH